MTDPRAARPPISDDRPERSLTRRRFYRWFIHIGLLVGAIGAVVTLDFRDHGIVIHVLTGLAFVVLVLVHLVQRQRTVRRMVAQLSKARSLVARNVRLAGSDALLAFLTFNVLISGTLDWIGGQPIEIPVPPPLNTWHKFSSVVMVMYLGVHLGRRRKRFRRSVIR